MNVGCQTAVHKRCHDKLLGKCPGSGRESESTIVSVKNVIFIIISIEISKDVCYKYKILQKTINYFILLNYVIFYENSFI